MKIKKVNKIIDLASFCIKDIKYISFVKNEYASLKVNPEK